jgi:SAM-dependent methyltransferase
MSATSSPDIEALKARIRATWTAGDFGMLAHQVEEAELQLIERLGIAPGTEVLDVACGTGNSAIPAARSGARVIGIDIAPNLLEQARARAQSESLDARFEEGDAEALAFPDASFDLVVTVFGAMFAPRPDLVAAELLRVCRPGGRIVMGNWTPDSFSGQTSRLAAKYLPPPAGIPTPTLWGDEETVRRRFRDGVSRLDLHRRVVTFRYPMSEAEVVDLYRRHFGPTIRAFEALDPERREAYRTDYEELWRANNQATDGTVVVPSEFLEVIATRA